MLSIQKANFVRNSNVNRKVLDVYTYSKTDKLGQGSYGMVYRAIHKETGIERAIKIIHKASVKQKERLEIELRTVEILDHPHVIRVFETFEDLEYIYVIMEICKGGDIFDKVLELGNFNEEDARTIFVQIARSIVYYQSLCIVHRDLKPENFLFQKKNDLQSLYIIDFGLARNYTPGMQYLWTKAGTAYYVAPEVLSGKYDNRCDMWSAGVMLYVLLCGYPPFYGETEQEILYSIQRGKFEFDGIEWKNVSVQVKDLICRLIVSTSQRLTAEQTLQHEWVRKCQLQGGELLTKKHIEQWQNHSAIKQLGLLYLGTQIEQKDVEPIRASFLYMNQSQSGVLQKSEIQFFTKCDFQNLEFFQFIALCIEPEVYRQEKYLKLMYTFLIGGAHNVYGKQLDVPKDFQKFKALF